MQKEKKRPLARSHPSIHPSLRGRILGAAPQATPHVAAAPAAAPSRALRAHARNNAAADRAYRLWPSSASRPAERQSGRALYVRMYPCGVHTTTGAARVGVGAACACTSSQGTPSPCAVVDRDLDPRGNQRVLCPGRTSATARRCPLALGGDGRGTSLTVLPAVIPRARRRFHALPWHGGDSFGAAVRGGVPAPSASSRWRRPGQRNGRAGASGVMIPGPLVPLRSSSCYRALSSNGST
jgi:hypothetical protein